MRMANWKKVKLEEVCSVEWGNSELTKASYIPDGEYLAVSAAGCDGRIGHREHAKNTPVISAIGANCGRMFLPREDFTAIKNTITITPVDEVSDGRYLYEVLTFTELPKRGGAQPFMSKGDIESFKIPLPPLAEQRKIAEILRTWDEAIETAEAELKAKQERKRVLMQGLFSKKDCVESFEGRYITEIAELSKDRPQGNETVCVDLEHVSPSAGQLIGSLPVNGDEVSKLRFRKDDVLFAKLRPYLKKAWLSDREGICSSEFWVFRAKQDLGDPAFLRQFVLSEPFLEACAASSGSKMPRADWAHVEKIKFMLPSLNEQRVTAGILQAADAEIDAINAIIKHLITQKRGLMQKLLTGEIRVAA